MIRSMTGYGRAESDDDQVRIAVELRSINNRFLKVTPRLPDGLTSLEIPIEALVRKHLSRGTVIISVTIEPHGAAARAPINVALLAAYWKDLASLAEHVGVAAAAPSPGDLLGLPGVVGGEPLLRVGIEGLRERLEGVVAEALGRLDRMREAEGRATAEDMTATLEAIGRHLAAIESRAPHVMVEVRERLRARLEDLLEGAALSPEDPALLREVAILAERSDLNEEISRLASHAGQFRAALAAEGPAGRRCEFLAQEMYREINTIGSKANDAEIARLAVEAKVGVDRLREQAQNIE